MKAAEKIIEITAGLVKARAFWSAIELGLIDLLSETCLPVEEITKKLCIPQRNTRALVVFLASEGILACKSGCFKLNPEYRELLIEGKGVREALRFECDESLPALAQLPELLSSGRLGFPTSFFSSDFPEEHVLATQYGFQLASMNASKTLARELTASRYDFSTLIDVGSGLGGYSIEIVRAMPHCRAILVDVPRVRTLAQEFLSKEAPELMSSHRLLLDQTCNDFFVDPLPRGGDASSLSRILHDWDDESCRSLLAQCRRAVEPGAVMYIQEEVLESDLRGPRYPGTNGLYLTYSVEHGFNRTIPEIRALLTEEGWTAPEVLRWGSSSRFSILLSIAR